MKSTTMRLLILTLFCIPIATMVAAPPGGPIGILSKVILEVTRKESGKSWDKAALGQTLSTGDMVRTGPASLAIIKFKDNSLVHLREKSELTVTGNTSGSSFSKSVEIQAGVVGFNVAKQRSGEEFRFTSPTSVASIRGTAGAMNASTRGDTLIVTDGTILFSNRISSQSLSIGAGFTGISGRDGSLQSHPSTDHERKFAAEALQGAQNKKLEIELRSPDGKPSRLKIEYKD
jgi:hypothetical protein